VPNIVADADFMQYLVMPVMLQERALWLTKREHSIRNLMAAFLLEDIRIMFICIVGWLLK
jgi:hypothetical protein